MKQGDGWNRLCLLLTLLAGLSAFHVRADAYVQVSIGGFSPPSITIAPGEAVYWLVVDEDGPYTISSPTGAWSPRYLYDSGDEVGITFNETGDYSYYDAFNLNNGVVHVRPGLPNVAPTGWITSPSNGTVFNGPASFTFAAEAADQDNGLMDVEFYVGDNLVDDVYEAPFATEISDLPAGSYTLRIIIYDMGGATTTASVAINVIGGPVARPSLSIPILGSGGVQIGLTGLTPGRTVVLQASSCLPPVATWTSLRTNLVSASSISMTAPFTTGSQFFRVLQLP